MNDFYNPFHFVPIEKRNREQQHFSLERKKFANGKLPDHLRHDRFAAGTFSGRLVVKLTTVTPVVVGGEQTPKKGEPALVKPYEVDGRPAIPASTLRGLVSSVAEAASNSALRVLDDRLYSYRRPMAAPLSAIGMIVRHASGLHLKPLALPSLESSDGGQSFLVPPRFRRVFPVPQFKVFFGDARMIRRDDFLYRTHVDGDAPIPFQVKQLAYRGDSVPSDPSLHIKAGRFAIAQDADSSAAPRPGYNRVLGCSGIRSASMPGNKKHELWIPENPTTQPLPILDSALKRFADLCDERTEESIGRGAEGEAVLPYQPRGTRRNSGEHSSEEKPKGVDDAVWAERFRLKPGDLVYFDVDERGNVTEIALSSIWRGRVEQRVMKDVDGKQVPKVEAAGAHAFVREVDKELLPFSPERETISLVEQMFGFVEEMPRDADETALGLGSRLRFANAYLRDGVKGEDVLEENLVTLRILSSPKPPSPALYFKTKKPPSGAIPKLKLSPELHAPQGRKWYLHQRQDAQELSWKTTDPGKNKDQKNRVRPIRSGVDFFFHIDFDNLTRTELGLLVYALEPGAGFHHKVGMGKPLGLGTVKLQVAGFFPVDRQSRYSVEGLRRGRYGAAHGLQLPLPSRYGFEANAQPAPENVLATLKSELLASNLISPACSKSLALLGDYEHAPTAKEVSYPLTSSQTDKEAEHFKWFMSNERPPRGETSQWLEPLDRTARLPKLRRSSE